MFPPMEEARTATVVDKRLALSLFHFKHQPLLSLMGLSVRALGLPG